MSENHLEAFQKLFSQAIQEQKMLPELKEMGFFEDSIPIDVRFQVYIDNVYQRLTNALFLLYPFAEKVLGKAKAEAIAHMFIKQHFPQTGCLDEWGETFPPFLTATLDKEGLGYLGDIAQLEWLVNQATLAPDSISLSKKELVFSPDHIPQLCFSAHPSFQLFASPYPLQKIWELCESPFPEALPKVSLLSGSSWACLMREKVQVQIYWLEGETYTFLESLKEGYPLLKSAEKVLALSPSFSFQKALQFIFSKGFFKSVYSKIPLNS